MTTLSVSPPRADYVPTDFADLFQHYYGYVNRLVCAFGIDPQNAEDVSMTILTRFYERKSLEHYSPDFETPEYAVDRAQVSRRATFSTFLSGFVYAYVRHHRNRQTITKRREGFSIYTPVAGDGRATSWVDVYGPQAEDSYDDVHYQELVRQIHERLQDMPAPARARVDITALFTRIEEQIQTLGKIDVPGLAVEFEVSQNTIRTWLTRLRAAVSDVLDV